MHWDVRQCSIWFMNRYKGKYFANYFYHSSITLGIYGLGRIWSIHLLDLGVEVLGVDGEVVMAITIWTMFHIADGDSKLVRVAITWIKVDLYRLSDTVPGTHYSNLLLLVRVMHQFSIICLDANPACLFRFMPVLSFLKSKHNYTSTWFVDG